MKDISIDIIITTQDGRQEWISSTMSVSVLYDFFKAGSTCINAMCEAIMISYAYVEYMKENGDSFDDCYSIHVYNCNTTELLFETSTEM